MALTTPSQSPAVSVREIDLTGVVPNVQSTTGAFVGDFKWGPVDKRTRVSDETQLVSLFGTPTKDNAVDFFSAAYFLKYSSSMFVVRVNEGMNAAATADSQGIEISPMIPAEYMMDSDMNPVLDSDNNPVVLTPEVPAVYGPAARVIKNADYWETRVNPHPDTFYAKYPGALGNNLKVTVIPAGVENQLFDSAPEGDELHVIISDNGGGITGVAGEVLETFAYVSTTPGAKNQQGGTIYITDVLNNQSSYVWMGEYSEGFDPNSNGIWTGVLSGGSDVAVSNEAKGSAYSMFDDIDSVTVDFIIAAQDVNPDTVTAIAEQRKDCVAIASPSRISVVGNADPTAAILATAPSTRSSYTILDNNFFKVYDKYNDQYIYIPSASSTAGIIAAADLASAPWFSPAGERRGRYLGVTDLAYNPSKSDRDELYKAGFNPVANIPGSGVLLYGDKTYQRRPSAFDRINVRRLFLTLERAIALAGKNVMFEMNDEFTRAEFVNIVEPLLREVQGRRGITDFRVVCDETNNTPAVVDRNEFVASMFIKPARSINYVTLNFVAIRTGVQFDEIVGLV